MDHSIRGPVESPGYPVGRCDDPNCGYREPHRHGLDCGKLCACAGVGAETAPLTEGDLATCDWGYCNRPAVALRLDRDASTYAVDGPIVVLDHEVWLSVCAWHAGWLDTEAEAGDR